MEPEKIILHFKEAIIPSAVVVVVLLVGYIVRAIIFSRIAKWPDSKFGIGKRIIHIIKSPMLVWFLMLGIYLALEISKLPQNIVEIAGKTLLTLGLFSLTLVAVNISTAFIARHSAAIEGVMPMTSLTQNIARIVIFGIGILIILNTLGIPISPILATLGVGGLAVALALQDTLSNVFAGFYITISRQLRIGDYVKLDTGEEGYIVDITWRTTKIKALPNNIILIPNEKLTKAICINYYLPEKEMSVLMQVGVHYGSDLEKVEKVTCEVGREVMKNVTGGVPEFEPFIRFHTFADSSINFSVILRAKEFTDQYLIKHEFIKRLQKRYAQEGITIPYPIRAINYTQEKAAE
ncbi:MAG: mechanosensitive ion channel family protein [Planctomycetaceae bacterium]|nr:mechanosensitive ion channel family protein [Planctomycetaceae bacterium]